ncbi:MAG: asparagine synthase (glutamine-hydrolyzing) [Rhodospirillales bacterium]|nr:asparagine synthase (glutamine-hydrolyzing) [Rhodospirillales bacterium]
MCGITAIFNYRTGAAPALEPELARIDAKMISRGPDGNGTWLADGGRAGLAHRRLAIIDPGPGGAQPMRLDGDQGDPRFVITYNGEIYNFRAPRAELIAAGRRLKTGSDTEVLLHLYDQDGPDMVKRLRGMFAFAIYDVSARTLFLARDPFGIKPLYYADDGKSIRVASQVKAILAGGAVDTAPDPAGHVGFFLLGYVPEPHTLFKSIRSLPAGTHLQISEIGAQKIEPYFNLNEEFEAGAAAGPLKEILDEALADSVRHHLVSDVPVGVFLSAGLDSATITALASENADASLDTMTLNFDEMAGTPGNEAPLAELVARQCGTRHQTRTVSGAEFHKSLDQLLDAMDQPSIDGVNTYFVAREASAMGLKVALSGIGGDELFGGYDSFRQVPALNRALGWVPGLKYFGAGFRMVSAPLLKHVTSPKYAGLFEYGGSTGGAYLLRRGLYMPWELADVLDADMASEGWRALNLENRLWKTTNGISSPKSQVAALEMSWYMRGQLLRDADWAGMAHSLEIRTPLVDRELFKRTAGLGASKLQMAAAPKTALPDQILSRRKTGFHVPIRQWLSGDKDLGGRGERGLRGWAGLVHARASAA